MPFSSVIFLSAFLPVLLIFYFGVCSLFKEKKQLAQNVTLLFFSILFYAYGEKLVVLLLIASWLCNHFLALAISKAEKWKRVILGLSIVLNLSALFVYKYLGFVAGIISNILNVEIHVFVPALPIGISFFTFQAISYVVDVYKGKAEATKNMVKSGLYLTLFPTLLSGPILRSNTVFDKFENREVNRDGFYKGVRRFVIGLLKKVLIADSLALMSDRIFEYVNGGGETSLMLAWLGAITYTLQIYYDFSGYSDMAIGMGGVLGFDIPENFNFPYIASSVKEFWRRWHISLSQWFRDYVYIPLGGNKAGNARTYFNLLVVWILTGIWHGAGLSFIAWGLLYFVVLSFERLTGYGTKWKLPGLLSNIYTMVVVTVGWVIFRSGYLRQAYGYLRKMAGLGVSGLGDSLALRFLINNWVFILAALVFMVPMPEKIKKHEKAGNFALAILIPVAFIYVIKNGYSPFIYFNF